MRYKKCPRCELNYIMIDAQFCEVCLRELSGDNFYDYCCVCGKELDGDDLDICKECQKLEGMQEQEKEQE